MINLKVPRQIPLGSRKFKIGRADLRDDGLNGSISYHQRMMIKIDKSVNQTQRQISLWHEILHGINYVWKMDISEADIGRLAEGLNQVMQDGFRIELDWSDIPKVK